MAGPSRAGCSPTRACASRRRSERACASRSKAASFARSPSHCAISSDDKGKNQVRTIRRASIILLAFVALGAASARSADAPAWVKTSDENAQILLRLLARYQPENAARLGFSGIDDQILDLRDGLSERLRADTERALEELKTRRAATQDALVRQDLDILITAAEDAMRSEQVQRQYMLPYRNAALIVFSGIRFLLDPQIAKERQAAAVVRLKRYAGVLPGTQPIAQLARERCAERFATPDLVGPFVDNVRQDLADSQRYIDGARELLQKSGLTGWEDAFDRLAGQLKDYDAWVRAEILPRARRDNRLPEPVYADNLRRVGVDIAPKLLMAQAQFSFSEIQRQMDGVALLVARQRGYASGDYRDVIRELKKQQIVGEAIIPFYKLRLEAIEDIVRRERIVTLPQRKASIRLASAAETAAVPAPHMQPPQLIGNTGQYGEFVLPLNVPSADGGGDLKTDDFTFDAVAWTITAHEARPGHELQFSAMVE